MTEEEHDLLEKIKDDFWLSFKWLVRSSLDRAPEELENELRYILQDSTSCFHPGIPERSK